MIWVGIGVIGLLALWFVYVIVHEIRSALGHGKSFNKECDCSKGKALLAFYKAQKKKAK